MAKSRKIILMIAENAIIAAIYFVLTILTYQFAYLDIQFRIAEILVLLCFWRPDFVLGVTLGCFLSNVFSAAGPLDMAVGTAATLLSGLLVAFASPRLFVAALYPILCNAFMVGWELYFLEIMPQIPIGNLNSFWVLCIWVGIGETAVMIVGYFIWFFAVKSKSFVKVLAPIRHVDVKY